MGPDCLHEWIRGAARNNLLNDNWSHELRTSHPRLVAILHDQHFHFPGVSIFATGFLKEAQLLSSLPWSTPKPSYIGLPGIRQDPNSSWADPRSFSNNVTPKVDGIARNGRGACPHYHVGGRLEPHLRGQQKAHHNWRPQLQYATCNMQIP